jgi:hypothetical protein
MKRKNYGFRLIVLLILVIGGFSPIRLMAAPLLRVPKMKVSPVIDGKISEKEWQGASELKSADYHEKTLYRKDMDSHWYIGYDDKNLYIAMRASIPEGVSLVADTKDPKDNDREHAVLFGDHIELQISPHGPVKATNIGYGFYKIMANPFDVFSDTWWHCDEPGQETFWNSGVVVRSQKNKSRWSLEMKLPFGNMLTKGRKGFITDPNGMSFIVQLVRSGTCAGFGYGGIVPENYLQWMKFYQMIMDPDAPAVKLLTCGDVVHGNLDTIIKVKDASTDITASLEVLDAGGKNGLEPQKVLYSEKKTLSPEKSSNAGFCFKKDNLPVTPYRFGETIRNQYCLQVSQGKKLLFSMDLPFIGYNAEFEKQVVDTYLKSRPKGDYKTRIAYYPVNGKFEIEVNLDVVGDLPKEILDAASYRLQVSSKKGKKLLDSTFDIHNLKDRQVLDLGELDGEYVAAIELLNKNGKPVSRREYPFVRHHYPWENNTIGKQRVIVPPFRPLQKDGNVLKTRTAEFSIGKGGLLDSVKVNGDDLLRSPMRFTGIVNGKDAVFSGKGPSIQLKPGKAFPPEFDQYRFFVKNCPKIPVEKLADINGYDASVQAVDKGNGLNIKVDGNMDYDNYYRLKLTLSPASGSVNIKELNLVIDLWDKADTVGAIRGTARYYTFPKGKDGIMWSSANDRFNPVNFKGNFVPGLAITDGFRFFHFRAKGDKGWYIDDVKPCQVISRENGKPSLILRLVNKPLKLTTPRTLDFAFFFSPSKPPVENWRHTVWAGRTRYFHAAYGWRLYGAGADCFYLPNDESYRTLGDSLRHPGKYPLRCLAWRGMKENKVAQEHPILMYSSTVALGAPFPAQKTYAGQWYFDQNVNFNTGDGRLGKMRSLNGTVLYNDKACFSEATPLNYDQSVVDCYLYYHQKLIALADTNGTMWDNNEIVWYASPVTGSYGYLRDDGHFQPECNIYMRRELLRRLFVMGWLEGKPPLYFNKIFTDQPWSTITRYIEGIFSFFDPYSNLFDCLDSSLSFARVRSGDGSQPFRYDLAYDSNGTGSAFNIIQPRSAYAVALLHDQAPARRYDYPYYERNLLDRLNREVGFLHEKKQARFIPTCDAKKYLRFVDWSGGGTSYKHKFVDSNTVRVAIYVSQLEPSKAVIWIVNSDKNPETLSLWVDSKALLGKPLSELQMRDFDTGEAMYLRLSDYAHAPKELRQNMTPGIYLPPQDYRAIIVEAKK